MNQGLGLVVALPAEARALFGRCLRKQTGDRLWAVSTLNTGTPLVIICPGPGTRNAAAAARRLVSRGMTMLGSLGVSGGLSPGVAAGDLILSHEMLQHTGESYQLVWKADRRVLESMYDALGAVRLSVHLGASLTVEQPVLSREEKAICFRETGALATDMESAAVAREAQAAGVPFFALRAVCDPATVSLPVFIGDCLDQKGGIRTLYLCGRLFKRPLTVFQLLRMQRDFQKGLRHLRAAWQGPLKSVLPEMVDAGR